MLSALRAVFEMSNEHRNGWPLLRDLEIIDKSIFLTRTPNNEAAQFLSITFSF